MEKQKGGHRHVEAEAREPVDPKRIIDISCKMVEALASPEAAEKWNIHKDGSTIIGVTTITKPKCIETVRINLRDPKSTDTRAASIALTSTVNINGQTDQTTTYSFVVLDSATIHDEKTVSKYDEKEERFKSHEVKGDRAFEDLENTLHRLPGMEGI